jgi:hypothetical protein
MEVRVIERKDVAEAVFFGKYYEGGVGQVHGSIPVLVHQSPHAPAVIRTLLGNLEVRFFLKGPESRLRYPAAGLAEQVHRLGKRGPGGQHRAGQLGQAIDTSLMVAFAPIEEGNERPGIG